MFIYVGKTNTNTSIVRALTLLPGPGTTTQAYQTRRHFPSFAQSQLLHATSPLQRRKERPRDAAMSIIAEVKCGNKLYLHAFLQRVNCTLMVAHIIPNFSQSRDIFQPGVPIRPHKRIIRLTQLSR